MASVINTVLGFSFKNGVLGTVVGNLKDIKTAAVSVSAGLSDINKKLKNMASVQSIAALGIVMKNTAGSIKSAALGISKSYDKVVGFAERGDKIAKTSKLLGLGVKEYQAFASAAQHSGMSVEEMDVALKKLSVNLGKARSGDKQSLKMFSSILPKGTKLSDYKSTSSVIEAISDSYLKLESAEQKAFVAQGLFGESGTKMSELFKDGSAGIKQMFKDFESNGGGFDDIGAKNAEEFNDELQKTKESINAISVSVMQDLFPTFIKMFREIRSYIKINGDELKSKFSDVGKALVNIVEKLLPKIPGYLDTIFKIVDFIGVKNSANIGILGYLLPVFVNVIGLLVSAVKVLRTVFSIVSKIFKAIIVIKNYLWAFKTILQAVSAFLGGSILFTLGGVAAFLVGMVSIVKQFYDNWEMWSDFVRNDLKNVSVVVDAIGNGVASFIFGFYNFFANLPGLFSMAWEGLKSGLSQIGSFLYDNIFGSVIKAIQDALVKIPIVGKLFGSDLNFEPAGEMDIGGQAQSLIQQQTITNRFAVDFQNMPQGVRVTPPDHGDFDWSRSYTLAGAV